MAQDSKLKDLKGGSRLEGVRRPVTFERTRWYEEATRHAGDAEVKQISTNIHTSHDYAKGQGLLAAIADGMVTTHWCSNMLLEYFGIDYLELGELRNKYNKPVLFDVPVTVLGSVVEMEDRVGLDR